MNEEPNEMVNNDRGSLELTGIPKCIEVKMEDSDIEADVPEKVVVEVIGINERNVILKNEDEGILTEDTDYWILDQTSQDTTTTTSVETLKMECPDENVFEETKINIKLENKKSFKDKDMPDTFDIKNDIMVMAIKEEELTIKSEKEDIYEGNIDPEERNLDLKPCLRSKSESEDNPASDVELNNLEKCERQGKHKSDHKYKYKNVGTFTCDECSFQTKYRMNLERHVLRHRPDTEIELFICEVCDYRTMYKYQLKNHKLRHQNASKVEIFSCKECNYQAKVRGYLKMHMLRHKSANEVELFSCENCAYQTKYKADLKRHNLQHKSATEIEMFRCGECEFQTKYKRNLARHMEIFNYEEGDYQANKKHMIQHKSATEIEMFSCNECDFQTKYRYSLKIHKLVHKSPSEIEMFNCGECDYQARQKCHLNKHMLRHKSPSEIEMFSCAECDYQSRVKGELKVHMLRHKAPGEIEMLNCSECDFQTKYKGSLKRHKLVHKNAT